MFTGEVRGFMTRHSGRLVAGKGVKSSTSDHQAARKERERDIALGLIIGNFTAHTQ